MSLTADEVVATAVEMYKGSHDGEIRKREREGLLRALYAIEERDSVTAKVALDVALNDGAQDWPEAMRRMAVRAYGMQPAKTPVVEPLVTAPPPAPSIPLPS